MLLNIQVNRTEKLFNIYLTQNPEKSLYKSFHNTLNNTGIYNFQSSIGLTTFDHIDNATKNCIETHVKLLSA